MARRLAAALVISVLFLGLAAPRLSAQELDCRVEVDISQLSGSEFSFLEDDLPGRIEEYLNARNWTEDEYLPHERIACSMQIIILESLSLSEFRARLIVTSSRPIYGTTQSTTVLRVNDQDWEFEYSLGTSLTFNLDRYNALTSVLDFYAHLILGYDYDTFSPLGGTPYFEIARSVAEEAEGNGGSGWSSIGTQRNRARLISDLLDQRHQPLRRAYYAYHRKALDRFMDDTETARAAMLDVLETLAELNQQLSRSYALDLFFSTKYQEFTAFFANSEVSGKAYDLLMQIDPSHSSEYNKLVE